MAARFKTRRGKSLVYPILLSSLPNTHCEAGGSRRRCGDSGRERTSRCTVRAFPECERLPVRVDYHFVAGGELTVQQTPGQRVFDLLLN